MDYQYDFSDLHPDYMFDVDGRLRKARKTVAILLDVMKNTGRDSGETRLLDIGCSTGILTRHYAEHFGEVVGIDIDDGAIDWARQNSGADNVEYQVCDSMDLTFHDGEFDLVTCTHIYEHVPDSQRMLDEIFRVLKPDGFCYFAAENRVRLWEGHYDLPLLSVLPKRVGHLYVRMLGKAERYYETHLTLAGLRNLTRKFETIDYTEAVVREPGRFEAEDMVPAGSAKRRLALTVLSIAYWAFPTYLWVLRKPST